MPRYGLTHVTSSSRYPQYNEEAEGAVQTVTALLKKSSDQYIALLTYRSTPLLSGHSPAFLLTGRKLRSTLPILSNQLKPSWKAFRGFRAKDKHIRAQPKQNFGKRHHFRDFPFLHTNPYAWIDTPNSGRQPGVVQHSIILLDRTLQKLNLVLVRDYAETVGILHHCLHKVMI